MLGSPASLSAAAESRNYAHTRAGVLTHAMSCEFAIRNDGGIDRRTLIDSAATSCLLAPSCVSNSATRTRAVSNLTSEALAATAASPLACAKHNKVQAGIFCAHPKIKNKTPSLTLGCAAPTPAPVDQSSRERRPVSNKCQRQGINKMQRCIKTATSHSRLLVPASILWSRRAEGHRRPGPYG